MKTQRKERKQTYLTRHLQQKVKVLKVSISKKKKKNNNNNNNNKQLVNIHSKRVKHQRRKKKQTSFMQRLFDSLFNEVEADLPRSRQTSYDSGARGSDDPMPNKKNETPPPSSRSLSSVHSHNVLPLASEPENVQSSPSPTIEYLESSPPISVISSGRSRRTIQYLGSSSSRSSRPITISSGSR